MVARFSDLYDTILPYLPGAETPIIDVHIRRVARDFLRRASVWREDVSLTLQTGGVGLVVYPTDRVLSEARAVLAVSLDGTPLPAAAERLRASPGTVTTSGRPSSWWVEAMPVIRFDRVTDVDRAADVRIALTLSSDPNRSLLPDFVVAQFADEVSNGVVAAMMAMPGKPWSSAASSDFFNSVYVRGVLAARAEQREGGQVNKATVAFPRFGV